VTEGQDTVEEAITGLPETSLHGDDIMKMLQQTCEETGISGDYWNEWACIAVGRESIKRLDELADESNVLPGKYSSQPEQSARQLKLNVDEAENLSTVRMNMWHGFLKQMLRLKNLFKIRQIPNKPSFFPQFFLSNNFLSNQAKIFFFSLPFNKF